VANSRCGSGVSDMATQSVAPSGHDLAEPANAARDREAFGFTLANHDRRGLGTHYSALKLSGLARNATANMNPGMRWVTVSVLCASGHPCTAKFAVPKVTYCTDRISENSINDVSDQQTYATC